MPNWVQNLNDKIGEVEINCYFPPGRQWMAACLPIRKWSLFLEYKAKLLPPSQLPPSLCTRNKDLFLFTVEMALGSGLSLNICIRNWGLFLTQSFSPAHFWMFPSHCMKKMDGELPACYRHKDQGPTHRCFNCSPNIGAFKGRDLREVHIYHKRLLPLWTSSSWVYWVHQ